MLNQYNTIPLCLISAMQCSGRVRAGGGRAGAAQHAAARAARPPPARHGPARAPVLLS